MSASANIFINRKLKIAIVGAASVGKTALARRYVYNAFNSETLQPTVGSDLWDARLQVADHVLALQLWDTAGQERYAEVVNTMLRSLDGALVVYAVDSRESFNRAEMWVQRLREHSTPSIMLVGNKSDREQEREVHADEVRRLAKRLELGLCETSAYTGAGVQHAFKMLGELMLTRAIAMTSKTTRAVSPTILVTTHDASNDFGDVARSAFSRASLRLSGVIAADSADLDCAELDMGLDLDLDLDLDLGVSQERKHETASRGFKLVPSLAVPRLNLASLDAQLGSWVIDTARQTPRTPHTPRKNECKC
jgi:small GTP-binding protein